MTDLSNIENEIAQDINNINNLQALEEVRVLWLGKKGKLTEQMKSLGSMSPEERKNFGAKLNQLKEKLTEQLNAKREAFEREEMNKRLATETIDVTLPTRPHDMGRIHPISQAMEEMLTIFAQMGFNLAEGPDVEDDWHNFEALNFPKNHPARQLHDTFFMTEDREKLLRTHTSGVQIRTMENQKPPIKIVVPGRTYRVDYDATHTPMFHQIEGLVVDKTANVAQMKTVLTEAFKAFFGMDDLQVRFRPHYFPFTEPSFEADVGGELARIVGKEWLELLGCGMVHPNVLKNCGIDPEEYQGFAFGVGLDRLTMLKYNIPDLRSLFDADMRWIEHYGFLPLDVPTITRGLSMNAGLKK